MALTTYADLLNVMTKKHWKTASEIAAELDTISPKVLPALIYGEGEVFTCEGPSWKIKKKATPEAIRMLTETPIEDIKIPEDTLAKHLKWKSVRVTRGSRKKSGKAGSGAVKRGEGVDVRAEEMRVSTELRGHGFSYGKKKLYNGPQGQYWTDPNYKKRED